MYDYGVIGNFLRYGNSTPPGYNLENIVAPMFMLYSENDAVTPYEVNRHSSMSKICNWHIIAKIIPLLCTGFSGIGKHIEARKGRKRAARYVQSFGLCVGQKR